MDHEHGEVVHSHLVGHNRDVARRARGDAVDERVGVALVALDGARDGEGLEHVATGAVDADVERLRREAVEGRREIDCKVLFLVFPVVADCAVDVDGRLLVALCDLAH